MVDAMIKRMREPAAPGLAGTVNTCQHSVRLCHFSILSYVSPFTRPRPCSACACVALRACFGTKVADSENVQSVSKGEEEGNASTSSEGGGQERLIQVVDYVTASVTLHSSWAHSTHRGGARHGNLCSENVGTGGRKRAVLVIELPDAWTWERSDAQAPGGGEAQGRWADRSAAPLPGEATLEHILGPAALWLGEYKVGRQAGEKLSQILSGLNTSLAQILTASDGEQLAMMMQRNLPHQGVLSAQAALWPVTYATLCQEANAALATKANQFLAVQFVADCIELHSGLEQTDEGVIFHLNYRLKLPLPHAPEDLPPEACLAALDFGRWHPLWTCNLSASALAATSPYTPQSDAQAPALRVICQRYRGKPNDVGICMFGLGSDEHGVETLERRMVIRKSMDGFGASFSGLLPVATKTTSPRFFNMFLCKSGAAAAGNQASVRARMPRIVLPNSRGLLLRVAKSASCATPQRPRDDEDYNKDQQPHLPTKHRVPDSIFSDDDDDGELPVVQSSLMFEWPFWDEP